MENTEQWYKDLDLKDLQIRREIIEKQIFSLKNELQALNNLIEFLIRENT